MKRYSIGIDLGGTKILSAVINRENGEIVCSVKKKTKKEKGSKKIIKKLMESLEELFTESKISENEISSICIGAAGQIDRASGILVSAVNLDCYDLNLKEEIQKQYNIPVFVGNDVETATLGELKYGSARGYKDIVCIFVGTGIGSSIVHNGEIIRGATGSAGEFGHIIVDLNGRPCACGGNGCLEAYASRSAIEKRITGALKKGQNSVISEFLEDDKPITSKMIREAINQKDELVTRYVDEASEYLSGGIASIINFYNPQLIVLGGGLIDAVDYFYDNVVKKSLSKSLPIPAKNTIFKKAELGDFSGVIGATLLEKSNE